MARRGRKPSVVKAVQKELADLENLKAQFADLQEKCERFLESSRVCEEILGVLIPQVQDVTQRARLGVIESILDGACINYTG